MAGLNQPDFIEEQLANGRITCAAMSRQLLADPEWPDKVKNRQTQKFIAVFAAIKNVSEAYSSIRAHIVSTRKI